MRELATTEISQGIATVTMQRPEKRNALSVELINALNDAVGVVEEDVDVRAMILAGAGPSFCAGMDLQGVVQDAEVMAGMLRGLAQVMRRIRRLSIPTVARVQGAAVGGGCGLMVVTDFAVTHPESKVGYPEVDLAICPAVVAPWLILRVGPARARSMLLAGGTMSGQEGFEAGLATHLVDRDRVEAQTRLLAQKLASGGPRAMSATKQWLNELDGSMDDEKLEKGWRISAAVIAGEEAQARLREVLAGNPARA